jgi:hypothetical protein
MEFRAILLHYLELYVTALKFATSVYDARHNTLGHYHADTQRSFGHVRDPAAHCEEGRMMGSFPAFVKCTAAALDTSALCVLVLPVGYPAIEPLYLSQSD